MTRMDTSPITDHDLSQCLNLASFSVPVLREPPAQSFGSHIDVGRSSANEKPDFLIHLVDQGASAARRL